MRRFVGLHFCTMGGGGEPSSIFIYVSAVSTGFGSVALSSVTSNKQSVSARAAACRPLASGFVFAHHRLENHVRIYFLPFLKRLELFVRQERFMISFNVCSSVVLGSGKNMLLARSASGSYFIVTETYCLNPYQIAVADHLRGTTTTSFAHHSHTNLPFQTPPRSTVHRHIFIFENKDCTFETMWREHKTDPASLRGVNGIYSVYFLHAVHINPQRCQYTARIIFHSALVFQGKHISCSVSYTSPQERDNIQSLHSRALKDCIHQWSRIGLSCTILALCGSQTAKSQ